MNPASAILAAALAQATLFLVGLCLPSLLGWPAELRRLSLLTRQSCWAHFVYLLAANALLATVAICAPDSLLNGSVVSIAATAFAALYAASRLPLQVFVYDRSLTRVNVWYKLGELALMAVYATMAAGYGVAVWANMVARDWL